MTPDLRDLIRVQAKLFFRAEDLKPLSISLHHAVFDSIVNHFHIMSCAGWADVAPSFIWRRGQALQGRFQSFYGLRRATDHHAVACGEAPDAAACAHVDELYAFLRQHFCSLD